MQINGHVFNPRREFCNFALVNARSIRNNTLMLNDFIVETFLQSQKPGYVIVTSMISFVLISVLLIIISFTIPELLLMVAILTKKPFKVIKQLANFKSFEAYEAVLKSSRNYNLRFVNIYRPPPSTANGLSIALFLEEFSTYLEHLNLAPGHLLMSGDFNFHMDRPNDSDSRRFMSILDSFDLNQHVVGATYRDGHTLDLIITRVSDDALVSNCRVGDCISDHFAVHCVLQFNNLPLKGRK